MASDPREPKPSLGRIVLVRNRDGVDIPAIITALVDETAVHVHQFVPPGVSGLAVSYQWGVEFADGEPRPGTWRWPERT